MKHGLLADWFNICYCKYFHK